MRILRNWQSAVLVLLAGLLVAGCVTVADQREARKKERYAAYAALPPEIKSAVDQGLIKAGMNTDAVYIAWGKPDQVLEGGNAAGATTTWVYLGRYLYETRYWGYYRMHYAYAPVTYARARVVFSNGIVREWQAFSRP